MPNTSGNRKRIYLVWKQKSLKLRENEVKEKELRNSRKRESLDNLKIIFEEDYKRELKERQDFLFNEYKDKIDNAFAWREWELKNKLN